MELATLHLGNPFLKAFRNTENILKSIDYSNLYNVDFPETHDRDVNASINLYYVVLGRPELTPVEQTLAKNRSHPATR